MSNLLKGSFSRGDEVIWKSKMHPEGVLYHVVEVWNDDFVPRLLLTDVGRTSQKCNTALQEDCEIITRSEY